MDAGVQTPLAETAGDPAAAVDTRPLAGDAAATRGPASGLAFDWAFVGVCLWLVAGGAVDGWAHHNLQALESFFTPWHAVLYSGLGAVVGFTVATLVRNHARGYDWRRTLPAGYELSLVGMLIFAAAGVADMGWHTLFGVEVDLEAALSPTHIVLALGAALIVTGPLRAGWQRGIAGACRPGWAAQLPMVLSLAFLLSALTFMTQWAHPFVLALASERYRPSSAVLAFYPQALGVASVLLQTACLMGLVLVALRCWRLPRGTFTLVFTLNAVLLSVLRGEYRLIPAALLAGLAADVLVYWLRPSAARPILMRLFAFIVPVVLYSLYFAILMLSGRIWWSVHVWTGAVVLAGIVGWLVSYVLVPPGAPAERPG